MPKKSESQRGGEKKQQKKKGGAVINVGKEMNAVSNTGNLINEDRPWNGVVNDPIVSAMGFMPSPFSTGTSVGTNYMAGVDSSVVERILPTVGGAKKKAPAKPKAPAKKGGEKTAAKKKAAPKKK